MNMKRDMDETTKDLTEGLIGNAALKKLIAFWKEENEYERSRKKSLKLILGILVALPLALSVVFYVTYLLSKEAVSVEHRNILTGKFVGYSINSSDTIIAKISVNGAATYNCDAGDMKKITRGSTVVLEWIEKNEQTLCRVVAIADGK